MRAGCMMPWALPSMSPASPDATGARKRCHIFRSFPRDCTLCIVHSQAVWAASPMEKTVCYMRGLDLRPALNMWLGA